MGRTARPRAIVLDRTMAIQAACSTGRLPITQADKVSRLPVEVQGEIAAEIAGRADPVAAAKARLPRKTAEASPAAAKSALGQALDALDSALDRLTSELASGPPSPHESERFQRLFARSSGLEKSFTPVPVGVTPGTLPRRKPSMPVSPAAPMGGQPRASGGTST